MVVRWESPEAIGRVEPTVSYAERFLFTLFTNDPELARRADHAGINRVGLDLERIGKENRQGDTPGWISDHNVSDLATVGQALGRSELFVRTNPIHPGSPEEIDRLLAAGVDVLMLPFFRTVTEVEQFVRLVDERASVSLLVETGAAMARIHDIVRVAGIHEIHVGLNDLHLDLQLNNHFEVLVSGMMDMMAEAVRGAGIAFGFGGVARRGDKSLPIDPDLVYSQYPRLGADRALITRAFVAPDYTKLDLDAEVRAARRALDEWSQSSSPELDAARERLRRQISGLQL